MTNPNPVAPKTDTPATQIPEQLPEHQARVSRDSTLGSHMCSCGFGYPGISYEEWMRHYVRELESTLAAERASLDHWKGIAKAWEDDADHANKLLESERASRVQADTEQFNAGIEAAHAACERVFLDYESETDWDHGYSLAVAFCRTAIRALSKPSVIPEQAEETGQ